MIVLVDETVTFRSFRLAENVISTKLLFFSTDLLAKGFGMIRSEIAASVMPPEVLDDSTC